MPRLQHCAPVLTSLIFFCCVAGPIALCQATPASNPLATADSARNIPGLDPIVDQSFARYVIQKADVILLTFPLTPELNQTVTVLPDGFINLQSAGSVHAQGLTVPQLTAVLQKAYAGILHDPVISVDLSDFQKPYFTVSGQVAKPGQYELRTNLTVAEALAVAGGMTMATAKTQVFLFHRSSQDLVEVSQVNLRDVLDGKHVNEDRMLNAGDMIYVPEKFITSFRKYIPYSFNVGSYLSVF